MNGVGQRALWFDWRRLLSLELTLVQLKDTLQAIRPCRESETGWTLGAAMSSGNHSSLELNERGPALKVFWLREMTRSGRRPGERGACQKRAPRVMGSMPKKTEPEGAPTGVAIPSPLLLVRIRQRWEASGQPAPDPDG